MWGLGNYVPIANLVMELGRVLVKEARVGPGQRVLDVGAGTGNAALRAAEAGADVVASDLTPELLGIGRRTAEQRGLALDWVEADAQHLPFADGEFDVVLSCIGAMFALDHAATARELLRVCRPGGLVAMINWTPGGAAGEFLRVVGHHDPEPPPAEAPTLWGDPGHVQAVFSRPGVHIETSTRNLHLAFDGTPEELRDLYRDNFAPVLAVRAALAGHPGLVAALDRDLLAFAVRENRAAPGEPGHYEYEYLLALIHKP